MKNFYGIAISQVGYSHLKKGKVCQDSSAYFEDKNYAAIIVCDGHGGDKHFRSEIGSKFAINICERAIRELVDGIENYKDLKQLRILLSDFSKYLIYAWRECVREHYEQNPFRTEETDRFSLDAISELCINPQIAYGSTFILAITYKENLFIIKLGDGEVRVCMDDDISNPMPINEFQFGRTASLCNSDAASRIQIDILHISKIKSCIISTDGVINSFETVNHFEDFCKTLSNDFVNEELVEFENELAEFLPSLSERGSGDDVSIAILAHKEE